MTREEKRNAVVSRCRAVLMIATKSADERRERAYNAYGWARDKMLGMASGFWAIHELELEELANYYADVAEHKVRKDLYKK